ncbi:MAG: hypothetical protein LC676_10890 [Loktanella sp.]|nr:hypothetical protein [Loktanella sp.]
MFEKQVGRLIAEGLLRREKFIGEVMALTGRPMAAAIRLDRRLGKLSRGSLTGSHDSYRVEWRRRYIEGWAISRWPYSLRRFF